MKRRSGMVDYARRLVSLGGIAVLLFVVRSGFAATYTWDITPGTVGAGNSTLEDGAGAWNTTGTNGVWTNDGGANNVAWVNNTTTPDSRLGHLRQQQRCRRHSHRHDGQRAGYDLQRGRFW